MPLATNEEGGSTVAAAATGCQMEPRGRFETQMDSKLHLQGEVRMSLGRVRDRFLPFGMGSEWVRDRFEKIVFEMGSDASGMRFAHL